MFKEHNTEEIVEMVNENLKVTIDKEGINVKLIKKENITLDDLKQNLISKLNDHIGVLKNYESEIELLKIILENEK